METIYFTFLGCMLALTLYFAGACVWLYFEERRDKKRRQEKREGKNG